MYSNLRVSAISGRELMPVVLLLVIIMSYRLIVSTAAMSYIAALLCYYFSRSNYTRVERLSPHQEVNSNRYARCTSRPQRHA